MNNKIKNSLCIIIFCICNDLFPIGLTLGGNLSNFKINPAPINEPTFILGKKIGVLHEKYDPDALFSIEYGLVFEQKGRKTSFDDYQNATSQLIQTYSYFSKLNYLTAPITIRWNLGDISNRFFINGGLYYSKLIYRRGYYKPEHFVYQNFKTKFLEKDLFYKNSDLGYMIGIGKQFNTFQVHLKTIRGLKDISINSSKINTLCYEFSLCFQL